MPASAARSGRTNRRRSRSSPRSNSRRASSPTTKKKNVIRPLLTQCAGRGRCRAAEVDREGRTPDAVVRRRVGVRPCERNDRRHEEDRGAAGLRVQELAQRCLDAPRPRRTPGEGPGARPRAVLGYSPATGSPTSGGEGSSDREARTSAHDVVRSPSVKEQRVRASGLRPERRDVRVARTEPGIAEAATARTAAERRRRSLVCGGRSRLAMEVWHRPGRAGWVVLHAAAGTGTSFRWSPRKAA